MKTSWDQLSDDNVVGAIVNDLQEASRLIDRQSFGSVRDSQTVEIKRILEETKAKIDSLLERLP